MAKFVLLYTGGVDSGEDTTSEWMGWFESLGDVVVDIGAPFGSSKQVAPGGVVSDGAPSSVSGYTIVEADNIDEAIGYALSCPLLDSSGNVEVHEFIEMG